MIAAQSRDRGHAVDERHVEVDHRGVERNGVGGFDGVEAVGRLRDDDQLRLSFDEDAQRLEIPLVVVRQQHSNRRLRA